MKKSSIFLIAIIILIISGVSFYWFEWRPSKIRHDCSWVKKTIPEKQADPGITMEQVEQSKKDFEQCKIKNKTEIDQEKEKCRESDFCKSLEKNMGKYTSEVDRINGVDTQTFSICGRPKEYQEPKPIEPARDEWRQADDAEYKFCLHDKGL